MLITSESVRQQWHTMQFQVKAVNLLIVFFFLPLSPLFKKLIKTVKVTSYLDR